MVFGPYRLHYKCFLASSATRKVENALIAKTPEERSPSEDVTANAPFSGVWGDLMLREDGQKAKEVVSLPVTLLVFIGRYTWFYKLVGDFKPPLASL